MQLNYNLFLSFFFIYILLMSISYYNEVELKKGIEIRKLTREECLKYNWYYDFNNYIKSGKKWKN